ncbi:pentatricopeptide repeat-containing protein [Tanacetum coccineum]
METCSKDRVMFSHLLDMLVAKIKDNIWALFFCILELDIESGGLKLIENDADVHALYDLATKHEKVELYVAHLPQNLAQYYHHNQSLSGADEEVTSKKKEHAIRKKDAGNMSVEELVAWAEGEANSPYLRSPPLKTRPFRHNMEGKVLFTDMYCPGYDAANIIDGMHDGVEPVIIDEQLLASIDKQILARQKKLDKGKCPMTEEDIFTSKKRKNVRRGNGISIRENDNPLSNGSDSEDTIDEYAHMYSKSEGDDSDKSFDYCDGEDEVIELRKRRVEFKNSSHEVDDQAAISESEQEPCNDVDKFRDVYDTDLGLTPLVRVHQKYTEALLRKLKGNGTGITYPFAIVEKSNEKYPIYDDQTYWKLKKPKLKEKFLIVDIFKECLTYYALENGFSLWFDRSTRNHVVISLVDEHTCVRNFNYGRLINKWIGRHFGDKIRNAKAFALNEGDAAIQDYYGYLRSYAKVIANSNEGSTVKKPNTGEILTTVGRDGNNHIFPMAWAVVTVKNKDNWSWFLDLLFDDLDVPNGNGLTLMCDQHKGLIEAVKEVMPLGEHRQCARHIYEGFRKQFGGVKFRLLFWAASKASYL